MSKPNDNVVTVLTCDTPLGADEHCDICSILFIKGAGPSKDPKRKPGATVLENVSRRITRPSESIDSKLGSNG